MAAYVEVEKLVKALKERFPFPYDREDIKNPLNNVAIGVRVATEFIKQFPTEKDLICKSSLVERKNDEES